MRKSNATNGDNLGTIGSRIRNLRKEKHITQETLEKKTTIARSTISAFENDKRIPYEEQIAALAEALDTSEMYLSKGVVVDLPKVNKEFEEIFKDLSEEKVNIAYDFAKCLRTLSDKEAKYVDQIVLSVVENLPLLRKTINGNCRKVRQDKLICRKHRHK